MALSIKPLLCAVVLRSHVLWPLPTAATLSPPPQSSPDCTDLPGSFTAYTCSMSGPFQLLFPLPGMVSFRGSQDWLLLISPVLLRVSFKEGPPQPTWVILVSCFLSLSLCYTAYSTCNHLKFSYLFTHTHTGVLIDFIGAGNICVWVLLWTWPFTVPGT